MTKFIALESPDVIVSKDRTEKGTKVAEHQKSVVNINIESSLLNFIPVRDNGSDEWSKVA